MRTLLTTLALLLVASTARADITTGLVVHFALNEGSGTNADNTGSDGTDGTLTGGPTWVAGHIGTGAVQFDGTNDHITRTGLAITGNAYTVAAWFKLDTVAPTFQRAFGVGDGTSGLQLTFITSQPQGAATFDSDGGSYSGVTEGTGSWVHYALVFDDGTNTITGYRNGSAGTMVNGSVLTVSGVNALTVACRNDGTSFFDGAVDEFRVYNRGLSAGDVAELHAYTGGAPPFRPRAIVVGSLDRPRLPKLVGGVWCDVFAQAR